MDLKYATMGSSLIPINPLVGGIATGIGFGADLVMDQQAQADQRKLTRQYNEDAFKLQPSVYQQPGGFNQVMPTMKKGGKMRGMGAKLGRPAGHIIPADKAHLAEADARKAGAQIKKIPGKGSPTADDRMLQVPGAEPAMVSSGEVFVSDDDFGRMARANGLSKSMYQDRMYPDADYDNMMATGGPINPPDRKQMYKDSLTLYNYGLDRNLLRSKGPLNDEFRGAHERLTKANGVYPEYNLEGDADGWVGYKKPTPPPADGALTYDAAREAGYSMAESIPGANHTFSRSVEKMRKPMPERLPSGLARSVKPGTPVSVPMPAKPGKPTGGYAFMYPDAGGGTGVGITNRLREGRPPEMYFDVDSGETHKMKHSKPVSFAKGGPIQKMADGGQLDWNPPMVNPPGSSGYQPIGYGPKMTRLRGIGQEGGASLLSPEFRSAPSTAMYNGPMDPMAGLPDIRSMQTVADENQDAGEPPPTADSADDAQQRTTSLAADMPGTGMYDPTAPEAITGAVTKSMTAAGNDDGSADDAFDELDEVNDRAAIGQAFPAAISLANNIFSRRTQGRPPMQYTPTMLDLNTEGLQADLQGNRQRAVATAAQNSRGQQSQSRNLGIGANDQNARRGDAMQVEQVENQERSVNTQISNQAKQVNLQRQDQFNAQDAAAENQFREAKGNAITQDLAGISSIIGGHAQGRIDIGSQRQLFGFQKRYYDALSGVPSSRYATPTSVFTGDKADEFQPGTSDAGTQSSAAALMLGSPYAKNPRLRYRNFSRFGFYR